MTTAPRSEDAGGDYARTLLAQQLRRYRSERERPRRTAKAPLPYSFSELDEIVRLAETWLPFGGPPEEEIFTRFGITTAEFDEKLQLILAGGRPA